MEEQYVSLGDPPPEPPEEENSFSLASFLGFSRSTKRAAPAEAAAAPATSKDGVAADKTGPAPLAAAPEPIILPPAQSQQQQITSTDRTTTQPASTPISSTLEGSLAASTGSGSTQGPAPGSVPGSASIPVDARRASFTAGAQASSNVLASAPGPAAPPAPGDYSSFSAHDRVSILNRFTSLVKTDTEQAFRQHWMPDESAPECYECGGTFNLVRRRHHCRICGQVMCSKCCSEQIPGTLVGRAGKLRCCRTCFAIVSRPAHRASFEESISHSILEGPKMSMRGSESQLSELPARLASHSSHPTSSFSLFSASPNHGHGEHAPLEDARRFLQQVAAERTLDIRLHREQLVRYANTFVASELINLMITMRFAQKREQAIEIAQGLLEAGFITMAREDGPTTFQDDYVLMRVAPKTFADQDPSTPQTISSADDETDDAPSWFRQIETQPFIPDAEILEESKDEFDEDGDDLNASFSPGSLPPLEPRSSSMTKSQYLSTPKAHRNSISRGSPTPFRRRTNQSSIGVVEPPNIDVIPGSPPSDTELLQWHELGAEWHDVLLPLAMRAAASVRPQVQNGDDLDVRSYVKVRCLTGGEPRHSHYYSGVIFTKHVAHKRMRTNIHDPTILILRFPLEFTPRGESKYASLETVLRQEHEFLKNAVQRIRNMRPQVVVAQKAVARIALDLLEQAGITLLINVKPSAVRYLARCTQATILNSIEELNVARQLGRCSHFSIEYFRAADDERKTLAVFDGCPAELGCTIILRGLDDIKRLTTVKGILKFLCYAAYHLELEKRLLADQFVGFASPDAVHAIIERQIAATVSIKPARLLRSDSTLDEDPLDQSLISGSQLVAFAAGSTSQASPLSDELELLEAGDSETLPLLRVRDVVFDDNVWQRRRRLFQRLLDGLILSTSPALTLPLPYLFTDRGQHCEAFSLLPEVVQWSPLLMPGTEPPLHAHDCFDVELHQSLDVLYSLSVDQNQQSCLEPQLVTLKYYSSNDLTLGYYVDQMCLNPNYVCPNDQCGLPVERHVRTFVHGDAQIEVGTERLKTPIPDPTGGDNPLLMWSWCEECSMQTPPVLVSSETWHMSLGKYLELTFLADAYRVMEGLCPHCFYKCHLRYFGKGNLIAYFDRKPIVPLEVAFAPKALVIPKLGSFVADWEDQIQKFDAAIDNLKANAGKRLGMVEKVHADHQAQLQARLPRLQGVINDELAALTKELEAFESSVHEWKALQTPQAEATATVTPETAATQEDDTPQAEEGPPIKPVGPDLSSSILEADPTDPAFSTALLKGPISSKATQLIPYDATAQLERTSFQVSRATVNATDRLNAAFKDMLLSLTRPKNKKDAAALPSPSPSPRTLASASSSAGLNLPDSAALQSANASTLTSPAVTRHESGTGSPTSREDAEDDPPQLLDTQAKDSSYLKKIAHLFPSNGPIRDIPVPLPNTEHPMHPTSKNFGVTVYEDEPSSLIAFTLSSEPYLQFVRERDHRVQEEDHIASAARTASANYLAAPAIETAEAASYPAHVAPSKPPTNSAARPSAQTTQEAIRTEQPHYCHNFSDQATDFYCEVWYAREFRDMRRMVIKDDRSDDEIEREFIHSLSRCIKWDARGGRSGADFCKMTDDRFILKQLSPSEARSVEQFLPHYFQYMRDAYMHNKPSLLAKIVGVYRIGYQNSARSTRKTMKQTVFIMDNLFFDRQIAHIYDLKGSMRNRHAGASDYVMLDENLVEKIAQSPLYIRPHSKAVLGKAIENDARFLSNLNIMDYSLLVGVDEQRQELVVGIIDYIRTFTLDKRLEMWIKSSGLLGGTGNMPTVISPRNYRRRFIEAMHRYFLLVPDSWTASSVLSFTRLNPDTAIDAKEQGTPRRPDRRSMQPLLSPVFAPSHADAAPRTDPNISI